MKNLVTIYLFLIGLMAYAQDLHEVLDKYNDHSIPYISIPETRQLQILDRVVLLDAREWEEYEVSHLPGAQFIGHRKFSEEKLTDIVPSKETPVVVYCSIGVRSESIAERLKALGYTQVKNLYGGIFEWANAGYPLQNKEEGLTRKVHAYSKQWGKYLNKGEKVY